MQIAAYGKGFVTSSKDAWDLFERSGMVALVDADMTRSLCFLSGVSSGSVCAIFAASWTFSTRREYTATVSLLALFVGYLMVRFTFFFLLLCMYYIIPPVIYRRGSEWRCRMLASDATTFATPRIRRTSCSIPLYPTGSTTSSPAGTSLHPFIGDDVDYD